MTPAGGNAGEKHPPTGLVQLTGGHTPPTTTLTLKLPPPTLLLSPPAGAGGDSAAGWVLPPSANAVAAANAAAASNGDSTIAASASSSSPAPGPPRALSVFSPTSRDTPIAGFTRDRQGSGAGGAALGARTLLPPLGSPLSPPITHTPNGANGDHLGVPTSPNALALSTAASTSAAALTHVRSSPRSSIPGSTGHASGIPVELSSPVQHLAAPATHTSPSPTPAGSIGLSPSASSAVGPNGGASSSSSSSSDKLGLFSTEGGCEGQNPDGTPNNELYFMGIIDILTLYGIGKKLENFGKSIKYNEDEISAVDPQKYADRFKKFIATSLR
jgi:hypothetical protein